MEALFLRVIELSITAAILVVAVVIIRAVFKKMPRWIYCLLWGLVAVRLLLPVSVESMFSLVPDTEAVTSGIVKNVSGQDTASEYTPEYGYEDEGSASTGVTVTPSVQIPDTGISSDVLNNVTEGNTEKPVVIEPDVIPEPIEEKISLTEILSYVWIGGIGVMLLYCTVCYVLLRRKVFDAVRREDGVWQSEKVGSPFILGTVVPRIYLPYNLIPEDEKFVIAHEKAHIRRCDHLIKPLAFLILSVHWFNPFIWVAYVLLCRDIEMACDEKVIKHMDTDTRKAYATALLDCCVGRKSIAACPLAFGEVDVKGRVKKVINYKKVTIATIIIACISIILFVGCFMTDPVTDVQEPESGVRSFDASVIDAVKIRNATVDEMNSGRAFAFLYDKKLCFVIDSGIILYDVADKKLISYVEFSVLDTFGIDIDDFKEISEVHTVIHIMEDGKVYIGGSKTSKTDITYPCYIDSETGILYENTGSDIEFTIRAYIADTANDITVDALKDEAYKTIDAKHVSWSIGDETPRDARVRADAVLVRSNKRCELSSYRR